MKKNLLTLATALLLLAGCASSVTKDIVIDTEADAKANFSGYKSYTWLGSAAIVFDPEGQWEPPQFDADSEIKYLIDRELRNRGMAEDSVNPDLVVAFAAGIDMTSMEIRFAPDSDLEATLENVPLGALTVILVDADTSLATWGAIATAEIQQNPDDAVVRQRLDYAVTSMFKKLPK